MEQEKQESRNVKVSRSLDSSQLTVNKKIGPSSYDYEELIAANNPSDEMEPPGKNADPPILLF